MQYGDLPAQDKRPGMNVLMELKSKRRSADGIRSSHHGGMIDVFGKAAMDHRMHDTDNDEERWQALLARDAGADARFVYAVTTTGVYCRPSCPSRQPLRRNVRFFAGAAEAEAAGFRACKRCRPGAPGQDRHAAAIVRACRLIEASDSPPALAELAAAAGMSRFHFHRAFKNVTGLTPREYAQTRQAQRMKAALRTQETVTDALHEAGFSSSGRFYSQSPHTLAMTPREYRQGGTGITIRYTITDSALGPVLVAATPRGICAVRFADAASTLEEELRREFPAAVIAAADDGFATWVKAVLAQIENPARASALPLDIAGTAFQQRVWRALRDIPPGQTASYSDIAARIGQPTAVRAIARACAGNPVALLIPCHRVIRADGSLSGYRWGVARKQQLLEREGSLPAQD